MDSLDARGISVRPYACQRIASLRYFDSAGAFVVGCSAIVGGWLPGPLAAVRYDTATGAELILAWRRPGETLMLCADAALLAAIEAFAADRTDGCVVELTDGLWVASMQGARASDVLLRLGATTAVPLLGQSVTGRLAELTVTTVCVRQGEILMLVDAVYGDHLRAWLAQTLADF